jgi:hypothetical protein
METLNSICVHEERERCIKREREGGREGEKERKFE